MGRFASITTEILSSAIVKLISYFNLLELELNEYCERRFPAFKMQLEETIQFDCVMPHLHLCVFESIYNELERATIAIVGTEFKYSVPSLDGFIRVTKLAKLLRRKTKSDNRWKAPQTNWYLVKQTSLISSFEVCNGKTAPITSCRIT